MPTSAISARGRSRSPGCSSCCRRWCSTISGQGALVLEDPKALENPFFLMYPEWAQPVMVVLATAATVIASQAVITGAYSLTRQAIQLGLLPRFEIRHTSETHSGQIYMPRVNTFLFFGVVLLVAIFKSSSALASAYGIAVTGTMVVTAMMGFVVIWKVWKWSPLAAAALIGPFLLLDLIFLSRQPAQGGRGRLGAARARRHGHGRDVHVAARQPPAVREDAEERAAAEGSGLDAGEAAAAARAGHGGVFDRASRQRADRADAQPEALQGAAREERHPDHRDARRRRASTSPIASTWKTSAGRSRA